MGRSPPIRLAARLRGGRKDWPTVRANRIIDRRARVLATTTSRRTHEPISPACFPVHLNVDATAGGLDPIPALARPPGCDGPASGHSQLAGEGGGSHGPLTPTQGDRGARLPTCERSSDTSERQGCTSKRRSEPQEGAALDCREIAEDLVHRRAQRLRTIDDDQQPVVGGWAPGDQLSEHRPEHGLVLRSPRPTARPESQNPDRSRGEP